MEDQCLKVRDRRQPVSKAGPPDRARGGGRRFASDVQDDADDVAVLGDRSALRSAASALPRRAELRPLFTNLQPGRRRAGRSQAEELDRTACRATQRHQVPEEGTQAHLARRPGAFRIGGNVELRGFDRCASARPTSSSASSIAVRSRGEALAHDRLHIGAVDNARIHLILPENRLRSKNEPSSVRSS